MSDYISREDAIEVINQGRLTKLIDADVAESGLKDLPAADVVHVVRCCDCKYREIRKWCNLHNGQFDDDAFCSYGEMKD